MDQKERRAQLAAPNVGFPGLPTICRSHFILPLCRSWAHNILAVFPSRSFDPATTLLETPFWANNYLVLCCCQEAKRSQSIISLNFWPGMWKQLKKNPSHHAPLLSAARGASQRFHSGTEDGKTHMCWRGLDRIFNLAFKAAETHFWLLVDFISLLISRHRHTFFMSLFHLPKTSCANY